MSRGDFAIADLDGDGELNRDEIRAVLMARKIVAGGDDVTEVLDRFFEVFDADKNGVIDGREFDAYLKTIS
jgi:hypothetical protein